MQPADRVAARATPHGDCLVWQGSTAGGYGYVTTGARPDRRKVGVHRVVLERKIGRSLGPGEYALHTCDVRTCVNPDHLYVGDHAQNMRDRHRRDRTARGTHVGGAKLTDAKVLRARAAHARGVTAAALAQQYGVSRPTMWRAVTGKTWTHLASAT